MTLSLTFLKIIFTLTVVVFIACIIFYMECKGMPFFQWAYGVMAGICCGLMILDAVCIWVVMEDTKAVVNQERL